MKPKTDEEKLETHNHIISQVIDIGIFILLE